MSKNSQQASRMVLN